MPVYCHKLHKKDPLTKCHLAVDCKRCKAQFFSKPLHGLGQIEINKHWGRAGGVQSWGDVGMVSSKWLIQKYPMNDKVSDQML